jgi:2-polyprenyl-3-methyl-5-hydroxy-6-metoxy-1,4-benzoquinol methylase
MNTFTEQAAISKLVQVRTAFESPERYLHATRFNIRIRQETVYDFSRDTQFHSILDVGCGDGSISVPLLNPERRLTLVDLSSRMLSEARARIPAGLRSSVETLNADFMSAPLEDHAYDLILCLGVLAHVDSPPATLERISHLLKPEGTLMLEFTDGLHPLGQATVLYHALLDLFRPSQYPLNVLSRDRVFSWLAECDLRVQAAYRYSLLIPGMHRVFSQESLYGAVRLVFGSSWRNRRAFLGNQYICRVRGTD